MTSSDTAPVPRVLVVDDNAAVCEFLSEVFTSWGPFHTQSCVVDTASSMQEALSAVDAHRYDLMVLDMVLGDGNGLQVLQGLRDREDPPPVIVLSADDPAEIQNKSIEMGARAFLRKGDGVEALVREALSVLGTRSPLAPSVAEFSDEMEGDDDTGRILVVDDDPLVCDALASMMALLQDVEVRTASGGTEGLNTAREWQPHVMLLDIAMPDLDGRQTLETLVGEGSRTRVIMVSGFRDTEIAQECVERGAVDYIPKPVDFRFLKKTVISHLALAKREAARPL